MADPGAVVLRSGRAGALVTLAAVGLVEVGLAAGVLVAVTGRGGGVLGVGSSWAVTGLLALVAAAVAVALVPRLLHHGTTTLTPHGVRTQRWGRAVSEIGVEELTLVRYVPASRAIAGRRATSRAEGRDPWHQRIELVSDHGTVHVDDRLRWPEAVAVVRGWVRRRPDLVEDPASASFLRDGDAVPAGTGAATAPRWPWDMVRLARREGDPWAPFLPDGYGRHSRMLDGRWAFVRAHERGGRLGLTLRWLFVGLWCASVLVLPALVAWLVLLVV